MRDRDVRKIKQIVGALLLVLLTLALLVQTAGARRWAFGDSRRWQMLHACKDGGVVAAIHDESDNPDFEPPPGEAIRVQARLYTNRDTPPPSPDQGYLGGLPEDYGPLIMEYTDIPLEKHPEPLSVVLSEDGSIISYSVYALTQVHWPPVDLSAGPLDVIMININSTGSVSKVEDCSLQDLSFRAGRTVPIGQDRLDVQDPNLQPEQIVYWIDVPPSHAALELDGAPLASGDSFTQEDVNRGRLEYLPNDPADPQPDYFAFLVSDQTSAGLSKTRVEQARTARVIPGAGNAAADSTSIALGDYVQFPLFFHQAPLPVSLHLPFLSR